MLRPPCVVLLRNIVLATAVLLLPAWLVAADRPGYTDTPFLPGSPWRVHDRDRPQPPRVSPGREPGQPPADAIVLFDGRNLDQWTGGNAAGLEDAQSISLRRANCGRSGRSAIASSTSNGSHPPRPTAIP